MLRNERNNRRGQLLPVLVCIIIGVSLGILHNRATQRGKSDPVVSVIRTVTRPFVGAAVGTERWFSRQVGWLFHGRTLARDNRLLIQQNQSLREEVARLQEADIDAARLRKQLGFQALTPHGKIAADIISMHPNPNFETMVISRGSRDGIKQDSVVVSPLGLIGHIYDVAPTSSSVLLLTDSNSAVGAMVQRSQSRSTGVCKGNGSGVLSMAYLPRDADVLVGDQIVSSGLGGKMGIYPKGLVIGVVSNVTADPSGAGRRVYVRPSVDFDRLEEVYILQ